MFETKIPHFRIRFAEPADAALILQLIQELAAYEKLEHAVTATVETLSESLFVQKQAEVLIGEYHGKPVGFALFFHNFSTFLGKANLYLEDLFLRPQARGQGFGGALFACLAQLAVTRGCERLDWWCLDWNKPSIAFYRHMGAQPMSDWTVYRVEGAALIALSQRL